MKAKTILATGISSTTFMTLYSYILSQIQDEHYREPELLGQLLQRVALVIKKKYTKVIGWSAHYLVGILFAAIYIYLWQEKGLKPTLKNGLLLGGLSGVVAIAVWKLVMHTHPDPPSIKHEEGFYVQLLPAHIVLGLAATLTYLLTNRSKSDHCFSVNNSEPGTDEN